MREFRLGLIVTRLLSDVIPVRLLGSIVRVVVAMGITPTALTIAGLVGNLGAAVLIGRGALLAGGIVILVAGALDVLDGAVARATGRATHFGALLDATFDRFSETAVLFGVLVYETQLGNREETLLVFLAAAGSLIIPYIRARAEAEGASPPGGIFTRPERVILLAVVLITGGLRLGLWILATLTLITAGQRLYLAGRMLQRDTS